MIFIYEYKLFMLVVVIDAYFGDIKVWILLLLLLKFECYCSCCCCDWSLNDVVVVKINGLNI